ncbi:LysE family translocator [Saccharopolyspora sp. K220]|uniref:LysE family translocator n=1 Tax=Saccharopolyspora soli TaxID=2926618 RepID=UPI001F5802D9|nr:LysE family translocator [Saccharopolyspora soli]MCI2419849.1 LysE family translocator [Saccharopolyspora soli]
MPDAAEWWVYLGAALLIAFAPGPGILYVLARSIRGGSREGVRSAFGNSLGATLHVLAAAVGLSAVLMASAVAFTVLKLVGAAYLIYLGVRALWELRGGSGGQLRDAPRQRGSAVLQGFVSEVFNPKTAMFFLAFLPQFVHPDRGSTTLVFVVLGFIFVLFTLTADLSVVAFAGPLSTRLARNPRWWRRQQVASGTTLIGLGGALAVSQN